ncbi:MAG TPA: DUF5818 domain-containing protein [Candidatus Sulfopaludibacter sp.]|jgi:hypothetical protein|nr:DUF5818 domain-containing protein [Candidatus Sulfopaludibacter sp.]
MTKVTVLLLAAATLFAGGTSRSFTGVITDSMCGANHKMMRVTPDAKCVTECVKTSRSVKYVLYDGKNVYQLSDQQAAAHFPAQKVKVTGVQADRTIQVSKIEPAR